MTVRSKANFTATYLTATGTWLDNATGEITPEDLRDGIQDYFDSDSKYWPLDTSGIIGSDDISGVAGVDFASGLEWPAWREGRVFYDSQNHTFGLYIDKPDVTLQLGQETHIRGVNKTGATIENGSVVAVVGAQGNRPKFEPAIASTSYEHIDCIVGLATHDIPDDEEGLVTINGTVGGVNTSTFSEGEHLYLSSTSSGVIVADVPSAPNPIIKIGRALNSTVNGMILVSVVSHTSLEDLSNVDGTTALDGYALIYNATGLYWDPTNISGIYSSITDLTNTSGQLNARINGLIGSSGYIPVFTSSGTVENSFIKNYIGGYYDLPFIDINADLCTWKSSGFYHPFSMVGDQDGYGQIGIGVDGGIAIFGITQEPTGDDYTYPLYFIGAHGNTYELNPAIVFDADGINTDPEYSGYLGPIKGTSILAQFSNNMTPLVNIMGDGRLGVKTTDPTHELDVNGSGRFSGPLRVDSIITVPKNSGYGIKIDVDNPTYGWRDIISAIYIDGNASLKPSWVQYTGVMYQYQFGGGASPDQAQVSFHMPHDYALGTPLYIHAHWSNNVVTSGSVQWTFDIMYASGHGTAGGYSDSFNAHSITISGVQVAPTGAFGHMICEVPFTNNGGTGGLLDTNKMMVDGLILARVSRGGTGSSDTLSQDPFLHFVDLHYQSTNLPTKNKAPNFYN
jgi:hypothetical protein